MVGLITILRRRNKLGYLAIDIRCADCDLVASTLVDREEIATLKEWECPDCQGSMTRTVSAPNQTRKSFTDGTKRTGMQDLKEASRLQIDMAELPHDKRAGISKEIKDLKRIKK